MAEPETLPCHNGGQTVKLYRGEHGAASGREKSTTRNTKHMNSTPYTGKVSGMKTSPWLASEDLLGVGPVKVKISAVVQNNDVEMEGGRKEACLFSLAFNGIPKQMILNATNRRTLSSAFGADTKQWIGAEIELYVQDLSLIHI